MKYLQEFLYCEFFCQCHFLWDLFILLITITFLNYIDKFAFTLFFGLHAQISWMAAVSTSPWLATYFFHKRITFVLTYTSSVIILCFFAILASLLAHSLFQLWIFVKVTWIYHWEIKGQHNCEFCMWLNGRCEVTNQRLWKKWHYWSLVMIHTCCLCNDLQMEEPGMKFVRYAIIHSQYTG